MCNSNVKSAGVAQIDGRPVLQPAGNRVAAPDAARPLKKSLHKSFSMPPSYDNNATVPARPAPAENTRAAPAPPSLLPPTTPAPAPAAARATKAAGAVPAEKPRSKARKPGAVLPVATFAAPEAFEPAGSIAAARREHAAQAQAQRKSRIAHYGRTASFSRVEGRVGGATAAAEPAVPASPTGLDEKRCSFITPYSGNNKQKHNKAILLLTASRLTQLCANVSAIPLCPAASRPPVCGVPRRGVGSARARRRVSRH
jgi:DNA-3-methyladenine glycosylase I